MECFVHMYALCASILILPQPQPKRTIETPRSPKSGLCQRWSLRVHACLAVMQLFLKSLITEKKILQLELMRCPRPLATALDCRGATFFVSQQFSDKSGATESGLLCSFRLDFSFQSASLSAQIQRWRLFVQVSIRQEFSHSARPRGTAALPSCFCSFSK